MNCYILLLFVVNLETPQTSSGTRMRVSTAQLLVLLLALSSFTNSAAGNDSHETDTFDIDAELNDGDAVLHDDDDDDDDDDEFLDLGEEGLQ